MAIRFFVEGIPTNFIRNKQTVKKALEELFKTEGKKLGLLSCILTTDEVLLEINKNFLQHNFFTDVITFGLSNESDCISGEIYISVERVKENAATLYLPVQEELRRVIIHGALHLCGYKDKTKREITIMRELENKYLRFFES